ncbi:putative hydrolase [Nymphaea thermarum]|nr:putative hydrolase [Nymphaea thermarum]
MNEIALADRENDRDILVIWHEHSTYLSSSAAGSSGEFCIHSALSLPIPLNPFSSARPPATTIAGKPLEPNMAAYLVQSVREMVWLVDSRISDKPTNDLQQADHANVGAAKAAKSHRRHDGRDEHAAEDLLGTRMQLKRKKRTVAGVDQEELLDPLMLADPDSCFHEFRGVHIHHKISTAEGGEDELKPVEVSISQEASHYHAGNDRLGLPMILLHGFGASLFSWRKVMKPLADLAGSSVLAFDRPAFGLTSRVLECPPNPSSAMTASTQLNPYSTAFSTSATLSFMGMLMGDKTILVGHSAGCVVAVDAYFEEPERVAALILVAPAIVAPLLSSNSNKSEPSEREGDMENRGSVWDDKEHMIYTVLMFLHAVCCRVQEAVIWMIKKSIYLLSCFCKNLISEILRSYFAILMVRFIFDRFGLAIVRNSWYDASLATEHDINGYTKPLRAKDWDKAILEFVIALLTDIMPKKLPSCKRSLSEIACPVLIITGDHDHIVPAWNAKRLSRAIPGSHLKLIKNCGHLPQEEKPQEFLSTVRTFLSTLKDV